MSKDLIYLLILTLITALAWLGFDIYHARTKTTLTAETVELIKPISPELDTDLIQQLKGLD